MTPSPRRTTTQRGLGWSHQQQVKALKRDHVDGSPCWWCGKPMFLDVSRNWDGMMLAGDHSQARSHGGRRADRLLHASCNMQRGDGSRDRQRPALSGDRATGDAAVPRSAVGRRLMDWPI